MELFPFSCIPGPFAVGSPFLKAAIFHWQKSYQEPELFMAMPGTVVSTQLERQF